MMIRINLLPVRQAARRKMGREIIVLFVVLIVGAGVGNFLWFNNRDAELKKHDGEIAGLNRRISELEKVIGEVNNIQKRRDEVKQKLTTLATLRQQRGGPVRMMDALSGVIPKKVWLADFDEAKENVRITGKALNHDDVAEMMRALQSVVWTPKGIARIVEKKREAVTVRVELLGGDGVIEDFPVAEVKNFFTGVELKATTQQNASNGDKRVQFEISMATSYAI